MTIEHANNTLLNALRNLFFRVSELELNRRTSVYRHRAGADMIADISTPMARKIDKIAAEAKKNKGVMSSELKQGQATEKKYQQNKKRFYQINTKQNKLEGLARHYKESAARNESASYLGEKLKSSAWSHLHTALMRARQGNTELAKLHAGIANQSLKEAANYMNKEDYNMLTAEVTKALKDLKQAGK